MAIFSLLLEFLTAEGKSPKEIVFLYFRFDGLTANKPTHYLQD